MPQSAHCRRTAAAPPDTHWTCATPGPSNRHSRIARRGSAASTCWSPALPATSRAPALGISPNGFKSVVDIDLLGTFHVLRAAFPHLSKPGASIVNISAPQAFLPMESQMHVCAAKAGVDMITRVAALEWGPAGVRVNSVVPGPIDNTEGMRRLAPTPEAMQLTVDSVPLKRLGTVDHIADACMWLSSPQAEYVSGVVLPVDGGWSLGGASSLGRGLAELMGGNSRR